MKKLIALATALALGACARTPPPQPIIRVQTVYCVTGDQYRHLISLLPPKIGATLTGQAQQDFKIEEGSNVLLRKFASGLLDVIGGCSKPDLPPPQPKA
jgi:hypothetical protein